MVALSRFALAVACVFAGQAVRAEEFFAGPAIPLPGVAETIAFDGTNFMAAWSCGTAICGARVTAAGGAVEAHTFVTTVGTPSNVRLASDGSEFLLVWAETRERPDIYAARITLDGASLDPGGFVVSRDLVPLGEGWGRLGRRIPEVAFDGTYFTVFWLETIVADGSTAIYTARVSSSGELLDPAGVMYEMTGQGGYTEFAVDGSVVAIAVGHYRYSLTWMSCLDWLLSGSGKFFFSPDLSVSGSSILVVFDKDDTHNGPYGGGSVGHFIGAPTESLIRFSPTLGRPLTAYEGTNHIVVWTEADGAVGLRVSPSAGFAETRDLCDPIWGCVRFPVPQFIAPGAATALGSNARGVSLVTAADSAHLLVSNIDLALSDALAAASALVGALDPAILKNANQQGALGNKIASIGKLVASRDYAEALVETTNTLDKTDGCALAWSPDADDWIRSCDAQRGLYATLSWIRDIVGHQL